MSTDTGRGPTTDRYALRQDVTPTEGTSPSQLPVLRIFERQAQHIITIDDVFAVPDRAKETGLAPSIGAKGPPTSRPTGSSGRHPVQLWLAGLLCFNLIKNEDSRKGPLPYSL